MENFIDYAVISNNQNPEYKNVFKWVQKRWNDLGIKTVYLDCIETNKYSYSPADNFEEDEFGNLTMSVEVPVHFDGDKWFPIMIYRFLICTLPRFGNKVMIISDGDLLPINKKYLLQPSYDLDVLSELNKGNLVATNMYPNGDNLATFTYGYGHTFFEVFRGVGDLTRSTFKINLSQVLAANSELVKLTGKYYINDEVFMNYLYKIATIRRIQWDLVNINGHWNFQYRNYSASITPWSEIITDDFYERNHDIYMVTNPGNRKWLEMVQEMNNLYEFQIPLLKQPLDLAPFVEMHNFRDSTMSIEKWDKLFHLLEEFDKYDVTPNCWYWNSIPTPWRDTRITKEGIVLLGDEYDK